MLGARLKQLRIEKKLTQKELAKHLGVSPSTVGMYEQGRRSPDTETVILLSKFFDVSSDYLIGAITKKDEEKSSIENEREITTILEKTKTILLKHENLLFDGKPASEEAVESIIDAMKIGVARAKIKSQ